MSSTSAAASSSAASSVSAKVQNDNKQSASSAKAEAPIVLITGASRGIGYGLAVEFATKFGYRVIATARTPATAKQLNDFAKTHSNVQVAPLDVADEKSIRALPALLQAAPYSLKHIDVLINNAGIASKVAPKETLANAVPSSLRELFETNVVGPFLISQVLLPFLRASSNPRLINVSSLLGSVKAANDGLFFPFVEPAYRISKAALNMLTATQASEFNFALRKATPDPRAPVTGTTATAAAATAPPITVVTWHPGYVASDMGKGSGGTPDLSVEQCASAFVPIAHALPASTSAVFLDWDGKKQLDW